MSDNDKHEPDLNPGPLLDEVGPVMPYVLAITLLIVALVVALVDMVAIMNDSPTVSHHVQRWATRHPWFTFAAGWIACHLFGGRM